MRSIKLYIDTLFLQDVADVVLTDVSESCHEAWTTLQSLSYVMLTDNYIIEYAAVLLRKLIFI